MWFFFTEANIAIKENNHILEISKKICECQNQESHPLDLSDGNRGPCVAKKERPQMYLPLEPQLFHRMHPPSSIYSPVSPLSILPFRHHELCSPVSTTSPPSLSSPCSDIVPTEFHGLHRRMTPDVSDNQPTATDIDSKLLSVS